MQIEESEGGFLQNVDSIDHFRDVFRIRVRFFKATRNSLESENASFQQNPAFRSYRSSYATAKQPSQHVLSGVNATMATTFRLGCMTCRPLGEAM
ncbi:MAG: hypothetical protein LKG11_06015 [Bacilli bacterium]|jgi:hypothetical protein|nr:hypothetical protein [Bacilli bacterium]